MKVVKYDPITKTYSKPFEVDYPNLLTDDMEQLAECPSCHTRVPYGKMYNTGEYYTTNGIWKLAICEACAQKIWDAERIRLQNLKEE